MADYLPTGIGLHGTDLVLPIDITLTDAFPGAGTVLFEHADRPVQDVIRHTLDLAAVICLPDRALFHVVHQHLIAGILALAAQDLAGQRGVVTKIGQHAGVELLLDKQPRIDAAEQFAAHAITLLADQLLGGVGRRVAVVLQAPYGKSAIVLDFDCRRVGTNLGGGQRCQGTHDGMLREVCFT
ncbi:hypothetical protein D3C75_803840 [compost metagenome]